MSLGRACDTASLSATAAYITPHQLLRLLLGVRSVHETLHPPPPPPCINRTKLSLRFVGCSLHTLVVTHIIIVTNSKRESQPHAVVRHTVRWPVRRTATMQPIHDVRVKLYFHNDRNCSTLSAADACMTVFICNAAIKRINVLKSLWQHQKE